jgi:RNA polymerase sigma-70 factor (ECF subfamily)
MLLAFFALPDEQDDNTIHQNALLDQQAMRYAQQHPAAFSVVYDAYVDRVYAFCLRRSATPHDAEDLCSQVFVRALAGLPTYQGGLVSAWIFRIARNVIANHYRGMKPIIALEDIDIPSDDPALERLERDEDRRIIRALIDALPEDKQTLLSLSLDGKLTSQDIGQIIGKSPQAVRVELHRVIKGLRARYFRLMEDES